ncbi:hypothetical protein SULI_12390 [Saccharolobus solfataricus]|uniref:DUF5808 domain-containing protein n=2 Tax=Saccharolobus solfataricus TaxID=2287 RepID=A0A0E3GX03_SACSO|nr:DUF1648 domain-containing protein [Saccharolobus solfataricus]AKA74583.1 hypothetical protein SULB_2447 [Saccharolobus solfataricus]AKA77279.1 hypothetical protein SULC_2444 [Saccharolobus solfataricus]AKA79971.1 hypothetical protein SULA_2446 [Saccharolobus solfataricus]AZF69053.1 hypothetical protein SULG_12390 [Saccharolobus solfataricus]AZF71673.1 hypothetical protein SULH_12390 [Saccharolobus solfataricus]
MTLLDIIIYVEFTFIFINLFLLPNLQPPDILLGARVTTEFKEGKGKDIVNKYRFSLTGLTLLSLLLYYFVSFASVFIYVILLLLNVVYWRRIVIRNRGSLPVASSRYAVIETKKNSNIKWIILFILAWGILIATFVFGSLAYSSAPKLLPTHVGSIGTTFLVKTPLNFYKIEIINAVVLGLLTALGIFTKRTTNVINPAYPDRSYYAFLKYKEGVSIIAGIVGCFISSLYTTISFFTWTIINLNELEVLITLLISTLFTIIIVYVLKIGVEGAGYLKDVIANDNLLNDDKYWKGGIIYVNPNDPRIWVPKRDGLGYTLNFGHGISILIILAIIFASTTVIIFVR